MTESESVALPLGDTPIIGFVLTTYILYQKIFDLSIGFLKKIKIFCHFILLSVLKSAFAIIHAISSQYSRHQKIQRHLPLDFLYCFESREILGNEEVEAEEERYNDCHSGNVPSGLLLLGYRILNSLDYVCDDGHECVGEKTYADTCGDGV